ncbi:LPS export ABC transporter periplasmic protein LptC [Niabella pedocola]|uniref:LPS export ABC transporter periplasmic protein LptC n=1 Tax=Niabella pedocola TaxID=1752077 RepID=A0ABS8PY99_9BACT|nr:OstA-like protein [Niabella pedocola]MCD2426048.1 LPS export ABC transporter periplasmic protein LptC [Niabella pedocola]
MHTSLFRRYSFLFLLLVWAGVISAQQPAPAPPGGSAPIDIIHADSLSIKKADDSTTLTILVGNVVMKQGATTFKCDRCVRNDRTRTFEAWGNVHINDSDTTNIYSGHLRYLTDKQIAYLDKNVKLTDGHATLTTPDMEYNMTTNIATYKNGGKVVNDKTVITSKEAFYYTDIKDVYFKKNVFVNDPGYKITTDSLLYNTENRIARFIALTHIKDSTNATMDTRDGYYNLKNGDAQFGQRPLINDGKGVTVEADKVSLDKGFAKAEGNAVVIDTIRKTTIIGNLIYQNRVTEAVLATLKPLMIIKQGEDSIFITADTLFSAKLTDLYVVSPALGGDSIRVKPDTLNQAPPDSLGTNAVAVAPGNNTEIVAKDSATVKPVAIAANKNVAEKPVKQEAKPGKGAKAPPLVAKNIKAIPLPSSVDPEHKAAVRDSIPGKAITDVPEALEKTINNPAAIPKTPGKAAPASKNQAANDSTNRYFEAFHHVKIYSDSLQAVCDSLFYSFKDSIFRLYQDPVVWGKASQITGDTIMLHTKNKQINRFEAYKRGFMINHIEDQAYNQVKATRLDGYFTNGNMDSVRAKGSAECIYYVQDADSSYIGVNQTTSDILDAYFWDKELKKVVLRSQATGTLYPIKDKSPDEMRLKDFRWREAERPRSKYDLMQ